MTSTPIYIYSLQGLRYPREVLQFFTYIPGAIWTKQHLTDTLTFQDHWSRDPHDSAERRLIFIVIIIFSRDVESNPGPSDENCELNHSAMLTRGWFRYSVLY